MRAFTARSALAAWERGQALDPRGRALALLTAALPGVTRDRLRKLPVGQRDALLLRLRQKTFGPLVRSFAHCPECQASLEFDLDLRRFAAADHLEQALPPEWWTAGDYEILFRLPDSTDFDFVAENCMELGTARRKLLQRCVIECYCKGAQVTAKDLPEEVIEQLGERMEARDPLAELPLVINCERCGHEWMVLFDIGVFLWRDIDQAARRLLDEVHVLAAAYGWREDEILSVSAARRRYYIEKIPESS